MAPPEKLQHIRGIGPVLARRLTGAGLETFARIAEAGEAELARIPGINQRLIPSILKQAAHLAAAGASPAPAASDRDTLPDRLLALTNARAREVGERHPGKLAGKKGTKLAEDVVRIAEALERLVSHPKRLRRAQKKLAAVERTLSELDLDRLRKVRKGFKKSRKILARVAKR